MYQLPDEAAVVCLIHLTTERLKALKAELRGQACPPLRVYREIAAEKRVATILCAAQAVRHQRLHRAAWTPPEQLQFVAEALPGILAAAFPQAA